MVRRPFLLNAVPERMRHSLFFRFYHPLNEKFLPLMKDAPLRYAPGATVDLMASDFMHNEIGLTGVYEERLSKRIAELGARGGLMVDVGANIGYFSLIWACANPTNRVIAFEASPTVFAMLRANVIKNGLENQISLHQIALGKTDGVMQFSLGPSDLSGWGGLANADNQENLISVTVKKLDNIIESETISFCKIDVEGADTWVIRGCDSLLREKRIEEISFEKNLVRMKLLGIDPKEAETYLSSVGYDVAAVSKTDYVAKPKGKSLH